MYALILLLYNVWYEINGIYIYITVCLTCMWPDLISQHMQLGLDMWHFIYIYIYIYIEGINYN